jgi:hypothetical protein
MLQQCVTFCRCACLFCSWFFTPSLNLWALVSGSPTVTSGNMLSAQFRVPSPSNQMTIRMSHAMVIDTANNRIFVMGGSVAVYFAEWMMFDISTGWWSLIGGSTNSATSGNYPLVKGMAGGQVYGWGRGVEGPSMWIDPSGGQPHRRQPTLRCSLNCLAHDRFAVSHFVVRSVGRLWHDYDCSRDLQW